MYLTIFLISTQNRAYVLRLSGNDSVPELVSYKQIDANINHQHWTNTLKQLHNTYTRWKYTLEECYQPLLVLH
jgi:hypothetical protein